MFDFLLGKSNKTLYSNNSFTNKGGNIVSDRQAALEMALKQIEKQFGKGSIMKLGEQTDRRISTISSGSLAVDVALGVGGYPRGRIIEIYGE